jgi:hypothetical protein
MICTIWGLALSCRKIGLTASNPGHFWQSASLKWCSRKLAHYCTFTHHLPVWNCVNKNNALRITCQDEQCLELPCSCLRFLGTWGRQVPPFAWLSFQLYFVHVCPCFIQGNDSVQKCVTSSFVLLKMNTRCLPHLDLRQRVRPIVLQYSSSQLTVEDM